MAFLSVLSYEHNSVSGLTIKSAENKRHDDKVIIFIFSDGLKTQFTNAKPILDKYGFKATFDVVCNNVGKKNGYMNWKEIKTLHDEGHEIGSHSMSHARLTELSKKSIEYEVGKSKKCLEDYGIKPTSFEYPFSVGSEDKTVVGIVAKYYDFATRGNDPLMFLRCDGMKQYAQKDCTTYTENGTPSYASKYSIRNWSHDFEKVENSYTDSQALERFIDVVNSQTRYNKGGTINAIPIIMYHSINDSKKDAVTDVDLFKKEMKYLHDNKFKVITISDLEYNEKHNYLYVKDFKSVAEAPTTNVTSNVTTPEIKLTTNVTSNVTTPEIEPTTNVTSNVTTPEIKLTTNVTSNVTTPMIAPEGNPVLEILKKLFGLK
jgi:peptidoglycan/xylan/chitin deacetylase (PgdA/CDA1 family)